MLATPYNLPPGYTPILDSVEQDLKSRNPSHNAYIGQLNLPPSLTSDEFTRAVAVATVSALRHQNSIIGQAQAAHKKAPAVPMAVAHASKEDEEDESGGHEAPSWTRGVSAGVLLGCTLLYAIIAGKLIFQAEILTKWSQRF